MEYIITFNSTHSMIRGEVLLREANIDPRTMPLPTSLGDSCGFCIRVWGHDLEKTLNILDEANIAKAGVYKIDKQGGKKTYIPVECNS
jgi:hypothetical protein